MSQQQIYCIDWKALVRGSALIGERCELRGFGPVSVSSIRRAVGDASANLVITDTDGRAVTVAHLGTGKINLRLIPGLTDPTRTAAESPTGQAARACNPQQLFETQAGSDGGAQRAGPLTRTGEPTQPAAAMMAADPKAVGGYGSEPKLVIIGIKIEDLTAEPNPTGGGPKEHAPSSEARETPAALGLEQLANAQVQAIEIPGVGTAAADRVCRLLGTEVTERVMSRGQAVRQIVHTGRAPNAAQRIALAWADTTCKVRGCANQRVEIDHRTPWATQRVTEIDNLDPLCSAHHDLKTNHGWQFIHPSSRSFVPPDYPDHPGTPAPRRSGRAGGRSAEY